jgi:hypothetical protein
MGARSHNCQPRADRLAALILLKFHVFSFCGERQFFHSKNPARFPPGLPAQL